MIEQMAVEGPEPRIVRVENDGDGAPGRHQYRVARGAGKALAVDLDMPVRLIITSSTRSPAAIGSGGTSLFQTMLLIDHR